MKNKYDVVIVGAGPAGSVTARTAAQLGLDVLLIEKRQEIGDPVRCAEGVSKDGLRRHIKPDKRWVAAEVKGSRIFSPDGTKVEMSEDISGKDVGFVLERKVFDRVLAQEAAMAGAEVMVKTRASGLIFNNGSVCGIKASHLGESHEIAAGIVIGADGVESKVGRWAGINTVLKPAEIETCVQFLVSGVTLDGYNEFYLGNTVAPSGYIWVFPKGADCANIGIGVQGNRFGQNRIDLLTEFIKKRAPEGKTVELVVGGVPVRGAIDRSVTDGLMLVGDACHQSDPLTGGGIINAMDAGSIAGEVAAHAIEIGDTSRKTLMEYDKRWRASIGKELNKSLIIKNLLLKLTDDQLNTMAHSLDGIDVKKMGLYDMLKVLFKANPRILWDLKGLLKD